MTTYGFRLASRALAPVARFIGHHCRCTEACANAIKYLNDDSLPAGCFVAQQHAALRPLAVRRRCMLLIAKHSTDWLSLSLPPLLPPVPSRPLRWPPGRCNPASAAALSLHTYCACLPPPPPLLPRLASALPGESAAASCCRSSSASAAAARSASALRVASSTTIADACNIWQQCHDCQSPLLHSLHIKARSH